MKRGMSEGDDSQLSMKTVRVGTTDLPIIAVSMEVSPQLKSFILSRIQGSLSKQAVIVDMSIDVLNISQILYESLIQLLIIDLDLSNARLNEYGSKLVKAMLILTPNDFRQFIKELTECDNEPNPARHNRIIITVKALLATYDEYLARNHDVYTAITSHHSSLLCTQWTKASTDTSALSRYASAANEMGSKVWVAESNKFMVDYIIKWFLRGAADKYYINQLLGTTVSNEDRKKMFDSLSKVSSLSEKRRKIRILDVGSCYNPLQHILHGDSSEYNKEVKEHFEDVTAIDLHPADPSVLRCDFLSVTPNSGISSPTMTASKEIDTTVRELPAHYYDVVTMSLVLCYLPTPQARLKMVYNARQLLIHRMRQENSTSQSHSCGLLIIAEKQSIFNKKPLQQTKNSSDDSHNLQRTVYAEDWKVAICRLGFTCVTYQLLSTSDGRKSHLFVFATNTEEEFVSSNCDIDLTCGLYIKHDFTGIPNPKEVNNAQTHR